MVDRSSGASSWRAARPAALNQDAQQSRTRPVPRPAVDGPTSWPVVIVGAGPAGLVAAITLATAGIRCLVLNRRTEVFAHPKATVVSLRTMELLRSWGLAGDVLAGGHEVEWRMLLTETLAQAACGQTVDVGYPTRAQSADLSPTWPGCVPQDHLESVLLQHLQSLDTARVELGVAVEDVRRSATVYQIQLRDQRTGVSRAVRAKYLIGADGARSVVRQRLDIGQWASEDLLESRTVVIHSPLWNVVGEQRYGIYVTDVPESGTFLPAGRGDRWLYGFSWDPRIERRSEPTDAELRDRVRAAAGVPGLDVRWAGRSRFTFAAAIADRFRSGNAFLVGDAAHRVTPRGGTGMNTAIADGYDLGWKLGWVLRGWATDSLLDSYEIERRPVAEHTLHRSIDPMGSRRDSREEVRVDLGGRLRHRWLDTAAGRISSLDLLGPGLTRLTVDEMPPALDERSFSGPLTDHRVDPETAAALGADRPGGLLLRPDGVAWEPPPAATGGRRAATVQPSVPSTA